MAQFRGHLAAILVGSLGLFGCATRAVTGGQSSPTGASGASDRAQCVVREVSRKPLVVEGGRQLYVEPAAFVANSRGDVLLGGSVSYLTSFGSDGKVNGVARDSVFGAVIRRDGSAYIVGAPIEGRLMSGIRAVARRDGGWEVVFAEVKPYVGKDRPDTAVRLWHGVYDGKRWTGLEQLPLPSEGVLRPNLASSLVQYGDSLAWAMEIRRPHRGPQIALFERRGQQWVQEVIPTTHAHAELGYSRKLGLIMAVVQPDTTTRSDGNSLFLWTRRPAWRKARRIVYSNEQGQVYVPAITPSPSGGVLGWHSEADAGAGGFKREARALSGPLEEPEGPVVTLDSSVALRQYPFAPVVLGGRTIWVVEHTAQRGQEGELLFVVEAGDGVTTLGRVPDPYIMGFVATVASGPAELLTAGLHYVPNRYLVTLLLRARVECRGSKP